MRTLLPLLLVLLSLPLSTSNPFFKSPNPPSPPHTPPTPPTPIPEPTAKATFLLFLKRMSSSPEFYDSLRTLNTSVFKGAQIYFLITFLKEVRATVHELADTDQSRPAEPKHAVTLTRPLAPNREALVQRLMPEPKASTSATSSAATKRSQFPLWPRSRPPPPPPVPSLLAWRAVVNSLTKPEASLLAAILHTPPAHPPPIANLDYIRRTLQALTHPTPNHASYSKLIRTPTGILLYGPPGNGKTILASDMAWHARQWNVPFLVVTPSTFFDKYMGESEKKVKVFFGVVEKLGRFDTIFEGVREIQSRPSGASSTYPSSLGSRPDVTSVGGKVVVFVDEVDGLFNRRRNTGGEEDGSGATNMKVEFLQRWDGISSASSGINKMVVVGASNRPFDIDAAFLRRMPRGYKVGRPNSKGRARLLKCILEGVPIQEAFDYDAIAGQTSGFNGSDLRELCECVANSVAPKVMGLGDFLRALKDFKPSCVGSQDYREEFRREEGHSGAAQVGEFWNGKDMDAEMAEEEQDAFDETVSEENYQENDILEELSEDFDEDD